MDMPHESVLPEGKTRHTVGYAVRIQSTDIVGRGHCQTAGCLDASGKKFILRTVHTGSGERPSRPTLKLRSHCYGSDAARRCAALRPV